MTFYFFSRKNEMKLENMTMDFLNILYVYIYIDIYIYIHKHVFCPAQDLSVWLGSTSREQLMSPECSKHQVLSLAKILVVNEQKIFCSYQCSPECSMNTFRAYISTYTCFVLPRTHQCGLR